MLTLELMQVNLYVWHVLDAMKGCIHSNKCTRWPAPNIWQRMYVLPSGVWCMAFKRMWRGTRREHEEKDCKRMEQSFDVMVWFICLAPLSNYLDALV